MSAPRPEPRLRHPAPVDRARDHALDELFISTTDRKGIIELSNDVFRRISAYSEEELRGVARAFRDSLQAVPSAALPD